MENDSTTNTEKYLETGTSLGSKTQIKGVKTSSPKPKIKVSIKKLGRKLENWCDGLPTSSQLELYAKIKLQVI